MADEKSRWNLYTLTGKIIVDGKEIEVNIQNWLMDGKVFVDGSLIKEEVKKEEI